MQVCHIIMAGRVGPMKRKLPQVSCLMSIYLYNDPSRLCEVLQNTTSLCQSSSLGSLHDATRICC